jgi:hypothetical protein
MLAARRSCFLLCFFLAFSVAACLSVLAQINGVPASVTSLGFGGSNNPNPGVRASVTSLGPNGFGSSRPVFGNCCANFFMPANPNPVLFFNGQFSDDQVFKHQSFDRQSSGHHRRQRDHDFFPVGVSGPVYVAVPYAVPYAVPSDDAYAEDADDDSADSDYVHAPEVRARERNPYATAKRHAGRDLAPIDDASGNPGPGETEEPASARAEDPVTAQPSTVLVFKDGHQSDVLNYAIVGNTLFDLGAGRTRKIMLADLDLPATRKANDERGVDFQIPASARQP